MNQWKFHNGITFFILLLFKVPQCTLYVNRFLRFSSGVTPADHLAAEPFSIHVLAYVQENSN